VLGFDQHKIMNVCVRLNLFIYMCTFCRLFILFMSSKFPGDIALPPKH